MWGRLLAGVALLLLYALSSTPTVEGQCPITDGNIQVDPDDILSFRNENNLQFLIEGILTGGSPATHAWSRNGVMIGATSTTRNAVTVNGDRYYIGGGRLTNTPCPNGMHRVALLVFGRLPGNYSYTVTNTDTVGGITRTFTVQDPGPVTSLTLRQVNGRRVQASWTAPTNPFIDYRVFINSENVNGNGSAVNSGTTTYTTNSEYTANTGVTINVRATSTDYWSVVTSESITILALLNPGVTSSSTTTSVTLTLTQPSSPGLPADKYTATLTSDACPGIPTRMGTTTTSPVMISNLEAGIRYIVLVIASSTATGLTSATMTAATTQEAVPSGIPGTPSLHTSTPTSMELSWTNIECLQQNGIITNFTIRYRLQGSTQDMTVNTQTAATSFNVTGLLAFTTYAFSVAGSNSIGMGGFSVTADIRTAEDTKVQNIFVEVLTLTSVRVSWERLDFSEITQYLVYYTQTENRKRQVESLVKVPATSGSVVISNLTSGRSYLFEVQAEVVLDGIVIVGPRSERNTVNTVLFTELRGGSTSTVIAVVVAVVTTIVMYSIILVIFRVICYCWKRGKNKDKSRSESTDTYKKTYETMDGHPKIEMKECEAYGHVSLEGSAQHYESVIHEENVYNN